ncbi:MAG: PaaI family thioesterase [Candidatus Velthaea sp.]|jgi:uncharacterized protein (TIGR00369 family)
METSQLYTHTFAWRDQALTIAAARNLSGRDYLEGMRRGDFPSPPFVTVLGFRLDEIDDGRVVFHFEPQAFMLNGLGVLHGGIAAGAFDTAVGCAALTVVPRDKVAITMDLSVRFFKPLTLRSGTARCEGSVINVGRTTASAEGRLFDASGRLCGHATSTLALLRPQFLDTPSSE